MRVVYSFSVPDNSIAHWQLKKWKAEGKNISGLLLKLIEGDGSKILELENHVQALKWKIRQQSKVLNSLIVQNPSLKKPSDFDDVANLGEEI